MRMQNIYGMPSIRRDSSAGPTPHSISTSKLSARPDGDVHAVKRHRGLVVAPLFGYNAGGVYVLRELFVYRLFGHVLTGLLVLVCLSPSGWAQAPDPIRPWA